MRESAVPRRQEDVADVCGSEPLSELRDLLVGPEQRQLDSIQKRLDDPGCWTSQVADILPDAVAQRAQDPALQSALTPWSKRPSIALSSGTRRSWSRRFSR
jgi:hypothetical protein